MRALGSDDDGRWSAAVAKELVEGLPDSGDVFGGDPERGSREADLGDEVAELVGV